MLEVSLKIQFHKINL